MITSNYSMDNLGSKMSNVIYPKTSMEDLNNCSNICFESNDGKSCDCITETEHKKGKDVYLMTAKGVIIYHQKPCNKNRPSSLMFDGIKLVRVAKPNKNWSWCENSKPTQDGNRTRCGMAIRNEHQKPAQKKLTHEQMFGKMRIYQGSIPIASPDIEAVIRWQASKARGKYDEEVKARASSSSTVKRERVQRAKWLPPQDIGESINQEVN